MQRRVSCVVSLLTPQQITHFNTAVKIRQFYRDEVMNDIIYI